jgi:hypothetical protein
MATRYITPLREGASLPAIVEADDDGMYGLWCMNRGNAHEINTLRFSALNRKT